MIRYNYSVLNYRNNNSFFMRILYCISREGRVGFD